MYENDKAAMSGASLYANKDTSTTITNVHPGSGEGWTITVGVDGSATVTDNYYSEKEHGVVAQSIKYETLWEAVMHIARDVSIA